MNTHTIHDRIAFRSSLAAPKVPTFAILNALQDQDAANQIEAAFLAAVILARPLGIDPHAMVTHALNTVAEADAVRNPHLEATSQYPAGALRYATSQNPKKN